MMGRRGTRLWCMPPKFTLEGGATFRGINSKKRRKVSGIWVHWTLQNLISTNFIFLSVSWSRHNVNQRNINVFGQQRNINVNNYNPRQDDREREGDFAVCNMNKDSNQLEWIMGSAWEEEKTRKYTKVLVRNHSAPLYTVWFGVESGVHSPSEDCEGC